MKNPAPCGAGLVGVGWSGSRLPIQRPSGSTPDTSTEYSVCYRERVDIVTDKRSQSDKFKEAARELEADEDEKRWEERLKKIARQKPSNPAP